MHGVYQARDEADLDRFLTFLGSRIVFLIDWNKARKALQSFVSKDGAIELLIGAAQREDGHRAFLELGGADLVFDAVRRAAAGRIAYGVPLGEALGESECAAFLRNVLHLASEGLKDGRSTRFIRDEIQADLSQRLDTAESELLATVLRHLGLTRMLAGMIETAFEPGGLADVAERKSLARRAKEIEGKGDRLTVVAREIFARVRNADELLTLIDQVENATDCFDEAAFLISLAPDHEAADALGAPLAELAAIARHCAAELVRAVEAAMQIPEGKRADAAFALQCVDAVIDAERDADAAERAAIGAIMSAPPRSEERPAAAATRASSCSASRSPARWRRRPIASRMRRCRCAIGCCRGCRHERQASRTRVHRPGRFGGPNPRRARRIEGGGARATERAAPARAPGLRPADLSLRGRHRRRRCGDEGDAKRPRRRDRLARGGDQAAARRRPRASIRLRALGRGTVDARHARH